MTTTALLSAAGLLVERVLPSHADLCTELGRNRTACVGVRAFVALAAAIMPPGSLAAQDLMVIAYMNVVVLNSIAYRLSSMRPVRIFRVGVLRSVKDVLGATKAALHLPSNVARVLYLRPMRADAADGR
ncbi:hypothetical protein G6321_00023650 [Bradyrhizobium barranii subsp. barranii]|uniref:Uncharacterized protein n=1 Tax=Bradyrhizobium barranii subsp. barranii TaxID=2823807 RepID=A0A7Z0TV42_9BRAD|nr:hypothetical protein [Bradyrhizobium barranii]UGX97962.1 hypothetical protein G6321_00023650 [Bradyrhizobium barranii subsp. barranii]